MDTEERVRQAVDMYRETGVIPEFNLYLLRLKKDDPLAFSLVEVFMHNMRHQYSLALRRGIRLLPKVSRETPWLAWRLLSFIGMAYVGMGEIEAGESYLMRALEIAKQTGDRESISRMRLQIWLVRFFKTEYETVRKEFLIHKKDFGAWDLRRINYLMGMYSMIAGHPEKAIKTFDSLLGTLGSMEKDSSLRIGILEMRALAQRLRGKFHEAMDDFVESAKGYADFGSAYSAFPLAKALELSRLSGFQPPPKELVRKSLSLAKKGSRESRQRPRRLKRSYLRVMPRPRKGFMGPCRTILELTRTLRPCFRD